MLAEWVFILVIGGGYSSQSIDINSKAACENLIHRFDDRVAFCINRTTGEVIRNDD